jgi:hypothetical protein
MKSRLSRKSSYRPIVRWSIIGLALYFLLFLLLKLISGQTIINAITVFGLFAAPVLAIVDVFIVYLLDSNHNVAVLMRHGSMFNSCVIKGMHDELLRTNTKFIKFEKLDGKADLHYGNHNVTTVQEINYQENQLAKIAVRHDVDAVVIRPVALTDEIVRGIECCLREGIFVICIDTAISPLNLNNDLPVYPFYIASDFESGGDLLAKHVIKVFRNLDKHYVLALVGPENSPPGVARSKSFLWRLLCYAKPAKVKTVMLQSWEREVAIKLMMDAIRELSHDIQKNKTESLILFCGTNDLVQKISVTLTAKTRQDLGLSSIEIYFLGYEGILDTHGILYARQVHDCIATVNVFPETQGALAITILLSEKNGKLSPQRALQLVCPTLESF